MKVQRILFLIGTLLLIMSGLFYAPNFAHAQSAYNTGSYGTCEYNDCGITIGADASTNLTVHVGSGATKCTTADAEIQVATQSSSGYSILMTDTDTDTSMENGSGGSIATTTGTNTAPTLLTANSWGYRVDNNGGFGSGPSTAASDTAIPSLTFAAIPSSATTPDVITNSSVDADPYTSTFVYYGLCANTTIPVGTYSDSVVYTAVVN